jgi:hypothetical protein
LVFARYFEGNDAADWLSALVLDLVRSGAAQISGERVVNL